jgi:hypothetical protein
LFTYLFLFDIFSLGMDGRKIEMGQKIVQQHRENTHTLPQAVVTGYCSL